MSVNKKKVDTALSGIQARVDEIGNKLFAQNACMGEDLKKYAFEIGMIRAVLERGSPDTPTNNGSLKCQCGADAVYHYCHLCWCYEIDFQRGKESSYTPTEQTTQPDHFCVMDGDGTCTICGKQNGT